MEHPDFKQIAEQLRSPTGQNGIATAERMSVNNGGMIKKCIDHLNIKDHDQILEIGPGGGLHVPYLFTKAKNINYIGADISETMVTLAAKNNAALIDSDTVHFALLHVVNGLAALPFPNESFDSIFTVNTLYFWDDALEQASEICSVLRPGGTFALCFATEAFMSTLPFTQFGFNLYTVEKAQTLLETAGFKIEDIITEKENVTGPGGELLEREFIVMLAKK
ncbi:MAG: class I SAM-dependent methyltransferase [Taibaiella sp.]|jgi:SAM-dependent methyltransferase